MPLLGVSEGRWEENTMAKAHLGQERMVVQSLDLTLWRRWGTFEGWSREVWQSFTFHANRNAKIQAGLGVIPHGLRCLRYNQDLQHLATLKYLCAQRDLAGLDTWWDERATSWNSTLCVWPWLRSNQDPVVHKQEKKKSHNVLMSNIVWMTQ